MVKYKGQLYAETKALALLRRDKFYFTGIPCKYGHVAPRLVSDGHCYPCAQRKRKDIEKRYPGRYRYWSSKGNAEYYLRNRDAIRAKYLRNRDAIRVQQRQYQQNNRDKKRFINSKYRAYRRQSVPQWADQREIEYIYSLAEEKRGVVDHIVPLQSKLVCGLHCADNLRVIPAELNSAKGNRYWPDMPVELE